MLYKLYLNKIVACVCVYSHTERPTHRHRKAATEYCLTIKKKLLIHATTWMNHKNLRLSERSQSQNTTYSMSPFI